MTRRKASTRPTITIRIQPYTQGSYLNAANIKYHPANFLNAALAGTGEAVNGGGPIWAIFDADAVKREQWTVEPPYVDIAEGYFFSANSIAALAAAIVNKYQRKPMPGATLENTVTRYNSFVDGGKDADFGKPAPKYKIDDAAVLRRLGHACGPRHARGTPHQREMPGRGLFRQCHSGPLLRRRKRRRIQPARLGAMHRAGPHRRKKCRH